MLAVPLSQRSIPSSRATATPRLIPLSLFCAELVSPSPRSPPCVRHLEFVRPGANPRALFEFKLFEPRTNEPERKRAISESDGSWTRLTYRFIRPSFIRSSFVDRDVGIKLHYSIIHYHRNSSPVCPTRRRPIIIIICLSAIPSFSFSSYSKFCSASPSVPNRNMTRIWELERDGIGLTGCGVRIRAGAPTHAALCAYVPSARGCH